jgi:hypothetical protein
VAGKLNPAAISNDSDFMWSFKIQSFDSIKNDGYVVVRMQVAFKHIPTDMFNEVTTDYLEARENRIPCI